jgi:hypothetical protein
MYFLGGEAMERKIESDILDYQVTKPEWKEAYRELRLERRREPKYDSASGELIRTPLNDYQRREYARLAGQMQGWHAAMATRIIDKGQRKQDELPHKPGSVFAVANERFDPAYIEIFCGGHRKVALRNEYLMRVKYYGESLTRGASAR